MSEVPQKSVRETLQDLTSSETMAKTLGDLLGHKKNQFLSTIVSMVNSDPKLIQIFYENPLSILNVAIQIVNLDLPLGNQFGFAYIIPRYNKRSGKNEVQMLLGYKGLLQMAIRSGKYKTIKAIPIHEGELGDIDYLEGKIEFKWIQNPIERAKSPIIGYVGILKFLNGFSYQIFMTKEEILNREKKFRQGQYQSPAWETNFDSMAEKTLIKMMLSRYGYVGYGSNSIPPQSNDFEENPMYLNKDTDELIEIEDPESTVEA